MSEVRELSSSDASERLFATSRDTVILEKIYDVKVTFLKCEKRKMREILEHCRAAAAGGVML